jgi:minor extracellular serine protease Vpr
MIHSRRAPAVGLAVAIVLAGTLSVGARPAGAPVVTRLVLLDAPTRWDAWSAALGGVPSAGAATTVRRAAADASAQAAERHIARLAAPVAAVVARAGGQVVARYDTAAAGLLVRLPAPAAAALATLPHVRAVRPAPWAQLALVDSAPSVGARRVARELGVDGAGTVIAVADSGVDYTHATMGGPGVEEAYTAARAAAERIDDTWGGRPLFPNGKVIAGWDFAGPLYAPDCDAILERMGRCSLVPAPDPDPLDVHGHGTHVAAIAAGMDSGPVADGVAPGAAVVALKIFGVGGRTDLLLDPLEWVLEANMGAAGRPHVDVLNFSLGQIYGGEVLAETGAIRRAVDAGVVVVAAAGNDGDLPFVVGAPAVAPEALAVASHVPPGRHGFEANLTVGAEPAQAFAEASVYHQGWSPDPRQTVTGRLVFVGRGCPAGEDQPEDRYLADPRGAIGVFQMAWGSAGNSCTADRQARRLQDAGAVGALMATAIGAKSASAWDAEPTVDIPVFMIADDFEQAVVSAAGAGQPMAVTLTPVAHPGLTGVVSSFTSRGPDRTGALKPDLSAPGTGIVSAAMGQGRRGVAASGTSMAAPHVAGAAALVWAVARRAGRVLTARDVSALLVTAADPEALRLTEDQPGVPPLARSGAGALDVWSAATAETLVRSGALAALDLGVQVLDRGPHMEMRTVRVRNLAAARRRYQLSFAFRQPGDAERGLSLTAVPATFELAGGAERSVTVEARFAPASFPPWTMAGGENVGNGTALAQSELDGWLNVVSSATDGTGARPGLRLPFYALVRPASAVTGTWTGPDGGPCQVDFANDGTADGRAELFDLVAADPPDPAVAAKVDLDYIGARAVPEPAEGTTRVDILLHTRGPRMAPLETESLVELDTDLDGKANYQLYTADEDLLRTGAFRNGQVIVALEEPGGGPFGSPLLRYHAGVDIQARYTVLSFRLEDTGLTPSTLHFQFRVRQRDLVDQDVAAEPQLDLAPGAGGWLTFDARAPGLDVSRYTVPVVAGGTAHVSVKPGTGDAETPKAHLVVLLPVNVPGAGDVVVLPPMSATPPALFLPRLLTP